jgi:hypothetical protein
MSTKHTITGLYFAGEDDDDGIDAVITYSYSPGRAERRYLRNGDPGYPAEPAEIGFVSCEPAVHEGTKLDDWAVKYLEDNWDDALECAVEDIESDEESAADARAEQRREDAWDNDEPDQDEQYA